VRGRGLAGEFNVRPRCACPHGGIAVHTVATLRGNSCPTLLAYMRVLFLSRHESTAASLDRLAPGRQRKRQYRAEEISQYSAEELDHLAPCLIGDLGIVTRTFVSHECMLGRMEAY